MRTYEKLMFPSIYDTKAWTNDIVCPISVKMSDREIINFLEKENELLNNSLLKLKDYCGEDYIQATKELEAFLSSFKVKDII